MARTSSRLARQLTAYGEATRSADVQAVMAFFAPRADFRSTGEIVRGRDDIAASVRDWVASRAEAEVVSIRELSPQVALVDTGFSTDGRRGRGWFTEIWQVGQARAHLIQTLRVRVGPATPAFDAVNRLIPEVVADDNMPINVRNREEQELRRRFQEFRTAFNNANTKAVTSLCTRNCNAIPVFSFLDGRAQILDGVGAIGGKAARMFGQEVINPDPNSRGATFIGGEAKVIRFLSESVAVVDGTAEINNIPFAHGFAPSEMRGVYTNIWRKAGDQWQAEGARAWF